LGDYAFPCFVLSKEWKKNPIEIAMELAKKIKPSKLIKEVREVGPYLNFFVEKGKVAENVIKDILKLKEDFGKKKGEGKTILVEYPGPNTNKPLHLGHVRNMVLGTALLNLINANGDKALAVNINNDRGVHICKSMLAYQKWGKGDSPAKSGLKPDFFVGKYYVMFTKKAEEDPNLKTEALEMVKKWEQGDEEVLALWRKMNKWAFAGFKETYKKFNVEFEKEYYESETYKEGKEIVLKGLEKGLFYKDDEGAVVVDLGKQLGKKVLLRADGTSVYVTQDLYLAKERYADFKFDELIYVVATEQNYHFQVLFKLLEMLKFPFAKKCRHFAYGMVNLTSGRMKSREGIVVDADDLVDDMEELAEKETRKRHKDISAKEIEKRAKQLGMAAIRFYLLKYESVKDILFDPKESLSFEGETGPYVQYAHARIASILKKYGKKVTNEIKSKTLETEEERKVILLLTKYPEIVAEAAENFKPHLVARYLLDLSQGFNEFYHACPILQSDDDTMKARLNLILAVKQVLANGLELLGIEAPEAM
jgi:arginyl-tRNA synthetase